MIRAGRQARLTALALGFLLLSAIVASGQAREMWPTLVTVLRDHSLPLPAPDGIDTSVTVTSFDVLDEPAQFAIAYYRDSGTDELKPPLYVLRYEKSARRWTHAEISGVQAMFTSGLATGDKPVPVDCLGSASISSVPGFLLVDTHLSPSASCLLVLSPDLKLVKALSGWMLAMLNSTLVYERSEVHFAPTHPLRIAAYDLKAGREFDIFPPANDPLRAEFQKRLAAAADFDWCREHNSPCDPKQMSIDLQGTPATNARFPAIAFAAQFSSEGFGPKADNDIGGETYFYVCQLAPQIDCRGFDEFDMKPTFGEASAAVLVHPDILRRLFSTKK